MASRSSRSARSASPVVTSSAWRRWPAPGRTNPARLPARRRRATRYAPARQQHQLRRRAQRPDRQPRSGWPARPPIRRRQPLRSDAPRPGAARAARGATTCRRRPRGSGPGRSRTGRAPVNGDRPERRGFRAGPAGAAGLRRSLAGSSATAARVVGGKGLAQDGGALEKRAVGRVETVEPRRNQRAQGVRNRPARPSSPLGW